MIVIGDGEQRQEKVRALLDPCSEATLITTIIARRLGAHLKRVLSLYLWYLWSSNGLGQSSSLSLSPRYRTREATAYRGIRAPAHRN
ncbi:hypothetical protein TKK_0000443 [Trichogramma kaykai]